MEPAYSPTPRQLETLRFIRGFQLAHEGRSPTLLQMVKGLALHGRSGAHRLVAGLRERGLVRLRGGNPRDIEVLIPVAVPKSADGAPLFFVPIGQPPIRKGVANG